MIALIVLVVVRADLEALPLVEASRVTLAVTVIAAIAVVGGAPRGVWSASSVFFVVLAIFHVGLVAAVSFGHEPAPQIGESVDLWLHRDSTVRALWLTELALLAYPLGLRLARLTRARPHTAAADDPSLDQLAGVAGTALVLGSIAAWFAVVLARGGPGLLVGSYRDYLHATEGSILIFTDRLGDFGIVFLAASRWSRGHTAAFVVFGLWSLVALPLGLRSEVLLPQVAALGVVAMRRVPMRTSRAVLIAIAVFTMIAAVRNLRQDGLREAGATPLGAHPLDGLAEMGASLRPVSEVVYWHDLGDPFDHGATYWAPIDRSLLYYVVPGWTRPPAAQDTRMMTNLVMDRAGPIGFSVVAEAYRNFAAAGVAGVLALLGFLLGRVDRWPSTVGYRAAVGVTLTGLFLHVRDTFVPLPTHFVFGFGLIAALVVLARVRAERARRAVLPRAEAALTHSDGLGTVRRPWPPTSTSSRARSSPRSASSAKSTSPT